MLFRKQKSHKPVPANRQAQEPLRISREGRAAIDADGIVLFHLSTGIIFRANRVGARIWQGLAENRNTAAIATGISRECGVPLELVERDTAAFIADLKAHQFLTEAEGL
jgi:Coenzyme PQQ synthesis protein D (PqqD)